ncbi:MAG: AraC family transcriptional regulator [Cytophagales bacterium]|nr:MAG: AraC family transcriptional regulator [Cytophagales bacterium]
MEIQYEDLGLQQNEIMLFRSFKGALFNCDLHYHRCYELTFIKKSSGQLLINQEHYNYSEGDLFLFGPGVPHSFKANNNKANPEGLVILINEAYLNSNFTQWSESYLFTLLFNKSKYGIKFHSQNCKKTLEIFHLFEASIIVGFNALKHLHTILFELAEAKIDHLLMDINIDSINNTIKHQQLETVMNFVNSNYFQDIKAENVAEILNMSYSSFNRFFKQKTKMTFFEYLQLIRLSKSKKMLIETTKSINEICFECGFNSASFFNRVFKKKYLCTPKDFRLKNS